MRCMRGQNTAHGFSIFKRILKITNLDPCYPIHNRFKEDDYETASSALHHHISGRRLGYTDDQILADHRVRAEMHLRDAGVSFGEYTRYILQRLKPATEPRRDIVTSHVFPAESSAGWVETSVEMKQELFKMWYTFVFILFWISLEEPVPSLAFICFHWTILCLLQSLWDEIINNFILYCHFFV